MTNETYLLRAAEIDAMDGARKTHFLNPNAQRLNKSLGDATGLTGLGVHLIEVQPGHETTELHLHHHEDECVYILSGTGTAVIGDQEHAIGPGDFLGYRKGGLAHTIVNTGQTALRCLVIGQRLPHDVCDYPNKDKRLFRSAGLPWSLVDRSAIAVPGGSVGRK
ncbi:cupin domain-containing protein [Thalassobius sp. S69A]|uniref:cupin domain-containing protein n=1 Tax=unclassified Thalassovita TaxID=2619711 RepID=UPI000C5703CB|nr:cupin [Paracoccaceae bacterium]